MISLKNTSKPLFTVLEGLMRRHILREQCYMVGSWLGQGLDHTSDKNILRSILS